MDETPPPRFLGWSDQPATQWTHKDLSHDCRHGGLCSVWARPRRALWSDDDPHAVSEGFDLKRWQKENDMALLSARERRAAGGIAVGGGGLLPAVQARAAATSASGISAWLPSTGKGASPRGTSSGPGTLASPSSGTSKLPQLRDSPLATGSPRATSMIRTCAAVMNTGDNLWLSELALSQNSSDMCMGCRHVDPEKLLERDRRLAEEARRRRDCQAEAGRKTRRLAARRQRAARRDPCASAPSALTGSLSERSGAEATTAEAKDAVRARRVKKTINRIQCGDKSPKRCSAAGVPEEQPHDTKGIMSGPVRRRFRRIFDSMVTRQRCRKFQPGARSPRQSQPFLDMPESQRQVLKEVFDQRRGDRESIDSCGVMVCLNELGLGGADDKEHEAVETAACDLMRAVGAVAAADRAEDFEPLPQQFVEAIRRKAYRKGFSSFHFSLGQDEQREADKQQDAGNSSSVKMKLIRDPTRPDLGKLLQASDEEEESYLDFQGFLCLLTVVACSKANFPNLLGGGDSGSQRAQAEEPPARVYPGGQLAPIEATAAS